MTIASEITRISNNIANAYTAIDNKGGDLPVSQNSANLATAIASIPSGGSAPVITSLSITPTTSAQTITAPSGTDGYSPINVAAVTSSIDSNITASNIKKGVTILDVTGSYEGSGGGSSGTTDVPLTRISDDNGNEIGTWYMNFEDANSNVYKVVVLDAQYRNASTQWCSNKNTVTNMPIYNSNYNSWWYDNAKEIATINTQLILDYCSAGGYTSDSCSHCRSKSFTIGGTTYYGQLPNMREVFDMWRHRVQIEQMDTSASSHSSTNFSSARGIWSSSQYGSTPGWYLNGSGTMSNNIKTNKVFACPVLEIPLS